MIQTRLSPLQSSVETRDRSGRLRRFGIAGGSALVACLGACAVPMLALAGVGGGVIGGLARLLRPGLELVIGGAVFLAVLGGFTIVRHRRRAAGCASCGPACDAGGSGG